MDKTFTGQNNFLIFIAVQWETGEPQNFSDIGIRRSEGGSILVFCPQSASLQSGSGRMSPQASFCQKKLQDLLKGLLARLRQQAV